MGNYVDHRHLLRDADRLAAVGQRIAEQQNPRVLGLTREDAGDYRDRRDRAGRGLVMFVQHDVEAEFVGEAPFVEAAVIDVGALSRVIMLGRQRHAHRIICFGIGQIRVGGFAEVPDSHFVSPASGMVFSPA